MAQKGAMEEQIKRSSFGSSKEFDKFVENYKFDQYNKNIPNVAKGTANRVTNYAVSHGLNALSSMGEEIKKEAPTKLPNWVTQYKPPRPTRKKSAFILSRSQLAESMLMLHGQKFRLNRHNDRGEWEDRRYLYPIYNTKHPRVFFMCGRQVEKSQTLANVITTSSIATPYYKSIYLSPSIIQTSTFSSEKLEPLITRSPLVGKYFVDSKCRAQVFDKSFTNGSYIFLRSAYFNADRVRGISAYLLGGDEIQDQLKDNLDVVSECLAHATYPRWIYACTPKSLDNTANAYWGMSTKGEWFVPCLRHGFADRKESWFWQSLDIKNIGKHGLICSKCGNPIFPQLGEWRWTGPKDAHWRGFRISQLMVPWIPWEPDPAAPPSIIHKLETYDETKFSNEVLGLPHDNAEKPITMAVLKDRCNDEVRNVKENMDHYRSRGIQMFLGGDWGTKTKKSYSIISVSIFDNGKLKVIFAKRFEGREQDYSFIIPYLQELITEYSLICGFDQGIGYAQNDILAFAIHGRYDIHLSERRIFPINYVPNQREVLVWNEKADAYSLQRTRSMNKLFQAIRRYDVEFPCFEDMERPFFEDILNIHQELRTSGGDSGDRMIYSVHPELTDDFFHAVNFNRNVALAYHGVEYG